MRWQEREEIDDDVSERYAAEFLPCPVHPGGRGCIDPGECLAAVGA